MQEGYVRRVSDGASGRGVVFGFIVRCPENQSDGLVVGQVVPHPVQEDFQAVSHAEDRAQVYAHP